MADVREIVKAVNVDSSDFNFVTRSSSIYKVVQYVDFLLTGDTSWRNTAGCLLNSKLLVIAVNCLLLVEFVRSKSLTNDTFSQELFSLISRRVVSRSFKISTLTSEVHFLKLREDAGSLCNNTTELDQSVQVHLAQITKLVFNRQVTDADKDVVVDVVVLRIDFKDGIHSNFIQHWEHECGLFSQPDGKSRLLVRQMRKVNL